MVKSFLLLIFIALPLVAQDFLVNVDYQRKGSNDHFVADLADLAQQMKKYEAAESVSVEFVRYNPIKSEYVRITESPSVVLDVRFKVVKNSKTYTVDCAGRIHDKNKSVLVIDNTWDCSWKNAVGFPVNLFGINTARWAIHTKTVEDNVAIAVSTQK